MKAKVLIIIILLILIGGLIMTGIVHKAVKTTREKGYAAEWNDDHEITGDTDQNQNQFLNAVIENRTDFPAGPVEGQIIYRTDENILYIFDGSSWQPYIGKADSCFCYLSAAQSIPHNTWTSLNWNTELWDTNNMHDNVVNPDRIYLKRPGFYQVNLMIAWDDNAVGYRGMGTIVSNCDRGAYTFDVGGNASPYGWFQQLSFVLKTTGDDPFFRVTVLQNSGGALNVQNANTFTSIQVTYLGAE